MEIGFVDLFPDMSTLFLVLMCTCNTAVMLHLTLYIFILFKKRESGEREREEREESGEMGREGGSRYGMRINFLTISEKSQVDLLPPSIIYGCS